MLRHVCMVALCVVAIAALAHGADNCTISPPSRVDCHIDGQEPCEAAGCCWAPVNPNPSNYPWCFRHYPASPPPPVSPPPPPFPGPPFNATVMDTIHAYLRDNIDIDSLGGVVAAPDKNTPGGSYVYAWERDSALTMRAWMQYSGDSNANIVQLLDSYTQWVLRAQDQADPHGIDIRAEPKYMLPHANVFTGGWCRPQQDGPGLRSTTLMMFAEMLMASGNSAYVKQYLWTGNPDDEYHGGAIYYDLEYTTTSWESNGCDPWENVENTAIFWVRYTAYRALVKGAAFANKMGDASAASSYASAASSCLASLSSFWNGQFIYEQTNRELDAAVILALNDGYLGESGEENFAPNAAWTVATVKALNELFVTTFPINTIDDNNGVPGVLFGRFKGDNYAGGNPWILCTAGLAELLYRAAEDVLVNGLPSTEALGHYAEFLGRDPAELFMMSPAQFAYILGTTGDGVLDRIHYHVASDNFHMAEQIDKQTGAQISATNLSWSYASVMKAMGARSSFADVYAAALV